ncbi:MAG: hypothetical protein Kow0069_05420 [Promethearchaeota archaeon]
MRAISDRLRFPLPVRRALENGSVEPDRRPDKTWRVGSRGRAYYGRMPHHHPDTSVVMKHAWKARKLFLKERSERAARFLGRVLHYVQDKSVKYDWRHERREEQLALLEVPEEAITDGLFKFNCSPRFVRKCVQMTRGLRDPVLSLYQAVEHSTAIAAAIFGPREAPENLPGDFLRAKERHRVVLVAGALAGLAMVVASVLIGIGLGLTLGIAAFFVLPRLDLKYYRLREEVRWFDAEGLV